MNARPLLFTSLLLFTGARAAHADRIADFAAGTAIVVETTTVDVGNGARTSAGSGRVAKAAGALDFALHAADLGVDLPLVIQFRGARLPDGRIAYTVDETYAPAVELGGGVGVTGVSGRVIMRVISLPGAEAPDPGNVRLLLAAPATLTAHTSAGDVAIAIAKLAVQGGVAQPPLAAFADPGTAPICADRVATYRDLTVSLTGPARGTGAVVALTRPRQTAVRLPPGIVVRAGRTDATVRLRIEPGFAGRVRLTAAAGGVVQPLDLVVRSADACR